jgi:hypothetical protein
MLPKSILGILNGNLNLMGRSKTDIHQDWEDSITKFYLVYGYM